MNAHFCKSFGNRSAKFGNSNTLLGEFQCYFKYMLPFWSIYILLFVYVILFVDWCGLSSNILVSTKMQFLAPLLLQKAFALWDTGCNCFCSSGDSPLPGLGVGWGWSASAELPIQPEEQQSGHTTPSVPSDPQLWLIYFPVFPRGDSNSYEIKSWKCKWTSFSFTGVGDKQVIISYFVIFL